MNPFAAIATPLVRRPGDYIPQEFQAPPRASRAGQPVKLYPARENPWGLTGAQCMVIELVAEGRSSKEIGERAGMSHRTVETHCQRARERMKAPNLLRAAILWDRFARGDVAC